jgi:hypothetical protein
LSFTSRDSAFLAQNDPVLNAHEKAIEKVDGLIELAHLEARLTRHLKDAEAIKAQLMALHKDEAANCMETAACAIEDSKEAIR